MRYIQYRTKYRDPAVIVDCKRCSRSGQDLACVRTVNFKVHAPKWCKQWYQSHRRSCPIQSNETCPLNFIIRIFFWICYRDRLSVINEVFSSISNLLLVIVYLFDQSLTKRKWK